MSILKDARKAKNLTQMDVAEGLRDALGIGKATGQNMLGRIERMENAPPSPAWLVTICDLLGISERYEEVVAEYCAVAAYQAAVAVRTQLSLDSIIHKGEALAAEGEPA